MKILFLCAIVCVFSIISPSVQVLAGGGIIVGNGGGFAEMQAIKTDHELKRLVTARGFFPELKEHVAEWDQSPLGFSSECPNTDDPDFFRRNPNILPSCWIYNSVEVKELGPRPKPIAEITAWVFAVRWMTFVSTDTGLEAYKRGLSLFSDLEIQDQFLPLLWGERWVGAIHLWSIDSQHGVTHEDVFVTLELESRSIDLTSKIHEVLDCSNPTINWRNVQVVEVNKSNIALVSPIKWICEGQTWQADLNIQVNGPGVELFLTAKEKR